MKRILGIVVVAAVLLVACSKEKRLNRKLDGTWNAVSMDGTALGSDESVSIKFNKDKKVGSYEATFTYGGVTDVETGTYELVDDMQVITTDSDGHKDTNLVSSYDKENMTWTELDGTYPVVLKKQ